MPPPFLLRAGISDMLLCFVCTGIAVQVILIILSIVIYFKKYCYLPGSFFSRFSSPGIPCFSPGMRYPSDAHVPRSMVLHRSEQNGRKGFPSHAAFFLQIGQMMLLF